MKTTKIVRFVSNPQARQPNTSPANTGLNAAGKARNRTVNVTNKLARSITK